MLSADNYQLPTDPKKNVEFQIKTAFQEQQLTNISQDILGSTDFEHLIIIAASKDSAITMTTTNIPKSDVSKLLAHFSAHPNLT